MDLIERYVHEVGTHLPRKMRKDVVDELRSTLEDKLEHECVEDEGLVDMLRQFGPPAEMAASYVSGPRHLIGPAHFGSFLKTIKGCLWGLGILLAYQLYLTLQFDSFTLFGTGREVVPIWM